VDHALCFGIALAIVGGEITARRVQASWGVLIALVLLLLPDTSINTAAHGGACAAAVRAQ
jgi:hypothetical protein